MAEPEDAIVHILRTIQGRLVDLERTFNSRFDGIEGKVDGIAERMDAFEGYFTYSMGLNSQNKVDVEQLQTEIKDIKRRLDELERQT